MKQSWPEQHGASNPNPGRQKLLVVNGTPEVFMKHLQGHAAAFDVAFSVSVVDVLSLVTNTAFDHVVVDLAACRRMSELIVPLLARSRNGFRLTVLCPPEQAAKYRAITGVDAVLTVPVVQHELVAALNLALGTKPVFENVSGSEHTVQKRPYAEFWQSVRGRAIRSVSAAYKNAAFVLLALLFSAFCFYGILIGFFLLSSSWGAPFTLSEGQELVVKNEQQINDMRVNLNLANQRRSEAELEAAHATRVQADAKLLVDYMAGTVDSEIVSRSAHRSTLATSIIRLEELKASFEKQMQASGMAHDSVVLFNKRLIDRKTLQSQTLASLEASQRLAGLEGELQTARDESQLYDRNIAMLQSLKNQLQGGPMQAIQAASSDLILLTKQAVDARAAFDQAKVQLASAQARVMMLSNSAKLLNERIEQLRATPLGRAQNTQVNVIFVPYGSEKKFVTGAPLYSCALTIIWCHRVGQVGAAVPGESTTVHPFFGKPLRGFFVEAELTDPDAAAQEIIHVNRPPFFL